MPMQRRLVFALMGAICPWLAACADPAPRRLSPESDTWSRDQFEGIDAPTAFDAAQFAAGQWFRLDEVRPERWQLTTLPIESDDRADTGRLRDEAIRTRSRIRRMATMRVVTQGDIVMAECRVMKQRLDTGDYRTLSPTRTFSEHPADNPLPAGASVTASQSEAWTDVGRDRGMERKLLEVMRERLRSAAHESPPPATTRSQ